MSRNAQLGEQERIRRAYATYRQSHAVSRRWSQENRGNRSILRERTVLTGGLLKSRGLLPLTGKKILDVGCGGGANLARFVDWGAEPENLWGVDLLEDRVAAARLDYPGVHFQCANAESIDFPDATFDLVVLFTVISSILDHGMARTVTSEVSRVLKPGGAVLWYDFRYDIPYNGNTRGLKLPEIRGYFPGFEFYVRLTTLLPPLARRLGALTPVLYPVFAAVRPLRTHYLGLLEKPRGGSAIQGGSDG